MNKYLFTTCTILATQGKISAYTDISSFIRQKGIKQNKEQSYDKTTSYPTYISGL